MIHPFSQQEAAKQVDTIQINYTTMADNKTNRVEIPTDNDTTLSLTVGTTTTVGRKDTQGIAVLELREETGKDDDHTVATYLTASQVDALIAALQTIKGELSK